MSDTRAWLLLVFVSLLVAGCKKHEMMPAPAIVSAGLANPFDQVIPERQNSMAPVFVAAPRTVSGNTKDPTKFYTNERSREVRVGVAQVEIGVGMNWDELVEQSRAKHRSKEPEVRVASYEEFGPLWNTYWSPGVQFERTWNFEGVNRDPGDQFAAAIERELDRSRLRQITVYVHGFNTTFGGNLRITGEFWHYMARDGVIVSFDWPSRGSVFSYQKDKANAEFGIRQFRKLLEFLAEETTADEINFIAHSAGTRIVIEAMRQISLQHYDMEDEELQAKTRIARVVLAAPDMDLAAALSARADGAYRATGQIAGYASRRDRALGISQDIFGSIRIGASIGKLSQEGRDAMIQSGASWVDATAAQKRHSTLTGHSYYRLNPYVSSDVLMYLITGASGEERGLERDYETGFLVFPDDYEERLPVVFRELLERYGHPVDPPEAD